MGGAIVGGGGRGGGGGGLGQYREGQQQRRRARLMAWGRGTHTSGGKANAPGERLRGNRGGWERRLSLL